MSLTSLYPAALALDYKSNFCICIFVKMMNLKQLLQYQLQFHLEVTCSC